MRTVAHRLNFNISEAQFPDLMENGPPNNVWNVYGRGVSMFVGNAMKDGERDRSGNIRTTFNPNRLDINVSKDSLWQRIRFEEVLIVARDTAHEFGWSFTKAEPGKSCAT